MDRAYSVLGRHIFYSNPSHHVDVIINAEKEVLCRQVHLEYYLQVCPLYNPPRDRAIGRRCLVGFLPSGLRQLIFSLNDYGIGYKWVFWGSVCILLNSISMHTRIWENCCVGERRGHASWQGKQTWFHTEQCCERDRPAPSAVESWGAERS